MAASPLAALKLIRIRRQPWRAEITPAGQALLSDLGSPPKASPREPLSPRSGRKPQIDLFAEFAANEGRVTVTNPNKATRHAYLSEVARLSRSNGGLPDDQRLRHTGRDSGDLVIWLEARKAPTQPPRVLVKIPAIEAEPHSVVSENVKALVQDQAEIPRTTQVANFLCWALQGSGYGVSGSELELLVASKDGITVRVHIEAQTEKVPELTGTGRPKIDAWGNPKYKLVPNGKAQIYIGESSWRRRRWADRTRWTVFDKIPDILHHIDQLVEAERQHRIDAEAARQARVAEWRAAVPRAVQMHERVLNATQAGEQLSSWKLSRELREFGRDIVATAGRDHPEPAEETAKWAQWLLNEADRLDPLHQRDRLRVLVPDPATRWRADEYMPHGWSISRPPP